ncbi:MAG: DUF4291 family protein [Bacteroidia bacterium]
MRTENFMHQVRRLPHKGKHIIGQTDGTNIIVYQAFNTMIAAYAIRNQSLGGEHYDFNRMTWIKPGFLWTMFRSGWATKEGQEHILAITLPLVHFKSMLAQAVISAYDPLLYPSKEEWKALQFKSDVRFQWDPDHDPYGNEEYRRAIQVGLRGEVMNTLCAEWIVKIEDITAFVKQEYLKVKKHDIEFLEVPYEEEIPITEPELIRRLGMNQ